MFPVFVSSSDQVHPAGVRVSIGPELKKENRGGDQTKSSRSRGMASSKQIVFLFCARAPENLTGRLKKYLENLLFIFFFL